MTRSVLFPALIASACSQPQSRPVAHVRTVKEFCLGARDKVSFARVTEITKGKGCAGMEELVLGDKVYSLEEGDTVEVIQTGTEMLMRRICG